MVMLQRTLVLRYLVPRWGWRRGERGCMARVKHVRCPGPCKPPWVHALHSAPAPSCVPVKRAALPGPALRPALALPARRLFNLGIAAPQHSASGSHVGQDLVTVLVMERKDCSLAAHLDLKEVRGEGRAGRRGAGRARWGLGGGRVT